MRLICFGDSNTWGFDPRSYLGGRYPASERWVDLLAAALGVECVNRGLNGRRIPLPGRGVELAPEDRLIVMLGSNDLLEGESAAGCGLLMEAFIRGVCPAPRRALIVAPPPMVPGAWVSSCGLIAASRALAEVYAAVAGRTAQLFADAAPWGVELAYDGAHFTPDGHKAFAKGIEASARRAFMDNQEVCLWQ